MKRESKPEGEKPCETCNDDPAVCATVPGLRHCEAAMRDRSESRSREQCLADALQLVLDDWANENTIGVDAQDQAHAALAMPIQSEITDSIPKALRAFYGDGTGGERECLARVAEKIEAHFKPMKCDSLGSSDCIRCGAEYLAKVVKELLAETAERAATELAAKQSRRAERPRE